LLTVATLVLTGLLPDEGMYPLRVDGAPPFVPYVALGLIVLTCVVAFAAGLALDRQYEKLLVTADEAARESARAAAMLAAARAELHRTLAQADDGLFTGRLIGNYRLGPLLGRGGMGEVYEGRRSDDGSLAAVKLIRADRGSRSHARFMREADALLRIQSPYVARVYEVGGDGEMPHIVMELLRGQNLSDLLRQTDRLTSDQFIVLITQLCQGLAAAHAVGVVHRDVKPSNIMRANDGDGVRWKLVDFGVAKLLDRTTHTTANVAVGTPPYMAPEQLSGGSVDARTDLYSLGLVAYRVLAGRPALHGSAAGRARRTIPDPRDSGRVDDDTMLALRIALAWEPGDRFASASAFATAFTAAVSGGLSAEVRAHGERLLRREPWSRD
jgi:serine/threonine-protein kinase